jgi:hypothetical protein
MGQHSPSSFGDCFHGSQTGVESGIVMLQQNMHMVEHVTDVHEDFAVFALMSPS